MLRVWPPFFFQQAVQRHRPARAGRNPAQAVKVPTPRGRLRSVSAGRNRGIDAAAWAPQAYTVAVRPDASRTLW